MNKQILVGENERWVADRHPPGWRGASPGDQRTAIGTPVLDLPTLLRIVMRWRWLVLGAVALGLALAIIVTMLTTPIYRAWVTLEANPPTIEIMDEQSRGNPPPVNVWDFVATQIGLLSSHSLAERVAQELNLANNPDFVDPEESASARLKEATFKVEDRLNVEAPEEGQIIRFSFDAETPKLAAEIANGIADGFINANLQRRYDSSAYARRFLERQISKTRRDLERSERQLVSYAQAQGIINTNTGSIGEEKGDVNSLQGESLIALNRALAEAIARRVALEGAYREARNTGASAEVNTSTQALRQTRAGLESEYQEKRTLMKPDHPDMLSLRSRITELDRQITRETAQVASGRSNSLRAEYRGALSAERALRGRVAELKGSVLNLRGRSIQYTILQREVDTNRSLYDALLQRYKEVGVAGGVGVTPVSIVDRADAPDRPHKPNLLINLLLGLSGGLLAGLATAVGIEFLNDTIKTRDDVRSKLGLPCLGAIPQRSGKGSFIDDLKEPSSIVSEAYSAVVASLRFSTETGSPKVMLVTSSQAWEGKSSSGLAIAQNFARRGKTVLLIDCDLRKPAFKAATQEVGLTKLLTNDEEVRQHILPTQYANLWLLPSGPLPPNPADLLSTSRFKAILEEASTHFDFVLVDAPPTLGLADAPLLAAVCENVMFVIESGRTRTAAAIEAINRIEATGAHVLGVTLTKATEAIGGYGYGYKHYGYGSVETKRTEILMIPDESES